MNTASMAPGVRRPSLLLLLAWMDFVRSNYLSSMLHTFQKSACDGDHVHLRCPEGSSIRIWFSQYGLQASTHQPCVSKSRPDQNIFEDANCVATSSLQVLIDLCEDKRRCQVLASVETFKQDPCPGVTKFLQVAYNCWPKEFQSKTVCEDDWLSLSCRRSNRIVIYSAMFGRTLQASPTCPDLLNSSQDCQSVMATEQMIKMCHGQRHCSVYADQRMFGKPCPAHIRQYLAVEYTCVHRRILKSMNFIKNQSFPAIKWPDSKTVGEGGHPWFTPKAKLRSQLPVLPPSQQGGNREKATLYFILGVSFGMICLLIMVIMRLVIEGKRKSRAKLDLTEPTHSQGASPIRNHLNSPILHCSDSDDIIEVVQFNPQTTMPRADPGNRSLNSYFG